MLYTFPFRYVDRSKFYSVREIDSTNTYIQLRGIVPGDGAGVPIREVCRRYFSLHAPEEVRTYKSF